MAKLLQQDVNGKMLNIIYSMYNSAKSCVRQNHQTSNYFYSNIGVRQGENLSQTMNKQRQQNCLPRTDSSFITTREAPINRTHAMKAIPNNEQTATAEPPNRNGQQLYHNIRNKHKPHSHNGGNNKQWTCNNRTPSPEQKAALSQHEEQI